MQILSQIPDDSGIFRSMMTLSDLRHGVVQQVTQVMHRHPVVTTGMKS